jgi:hypothetical protein
MRFHVQALEDDAEDISGGAACVEGFWPEA